MQKVNLEKAYIAIKEYNKLHGYMPSIREIGEMIQLKSTSSVHAYLTKLFELGLIETDLANNWESIQNAPPRAYRLGKEWKDVFPDNPSGKEKK